MVPADAEDEARYAGRPEHRIRPAFGTDVVQVCLAFTPAPEGYHPSIWSGRVPHLGVLLPFPPEGLRWEQPEYWVDLHCAQPYQTQQVFFDPLFAGARRAYLWLVRASPALFPVFDVANSLFRSEEDRLEALDPARVAAHLRGRRRALHRRIVQKAEAKVLGGGMFRGGSRRGRLFAQVAAGVLSLPQVEAYLAPFHRPGLREFRVVANEAADLLPRATDRGRFARFLYWVCHGWRVLGPVYEGRFDALAPPQLDALGNRCSNPDSPSAGAAADPVLARQAMQSPEEAT